MKGNMFRKGLVVGIIFLFIGIGVQPAFAVEITNIRQSSDDIDDCNCKVADNYKLEKYKNQIGKLESYSKLLLSLSKNNPEVKVQYQELLNDIDLFEEIYDDLENSYSVNGRPICDKLCDMYWTFNHRGSDYGELGVHYQYEGKWILSLIYFSIFMGHVLLMGIVWKLYLILGCDTVP